MTAEITPLDAFIRKGDWKLWLEKVHRDIVGTATLAESMELRRPENLISWLRGLNYYKGDVDSHIGSAKRRLSVMAPLPGESPTDEYLAAKREYDVRHGRRIKFKRGVEARTDEARFLIDQQGIDIRTTRGALIVRLAQLVDVLERDDIDSAIDIAKMLVKDLDA